MLFTTFALAALRALTSLARNRQWSGPTMLIAGFLLLIVCSHGASAQAPAETSRMPDIGIATREEISSWAFNEITGAYEKRASIDAKGLFAGTWRNADDKIQLAPIGSSMVVAAPISHSGYDYEQPRDSSLPRPTLYVLDDMLNKSAQKDFEHIAAFTTDGDTIFVCADGSFIALDRGLKELSRVELDCGPVKKDAHDVLIHGGTAFLLDNIMAPIYLFRVDVRDPKNLMVRQRIESFGINAHLKLQWVVPEQDKWFVVEAFQTRSGSGQELRFYDKSLGDYSVGNQALMFIKGIEEPGFTGEGFRISVATSKPPIRAIVAGRDLPKSLALVTFKGVVATIEPELRLADLGFSFDPHLLRYGPYLFMVPSKATAPSSRLLVFREGETLEKLYSLDIEHNSPVGIFAFTLLEPRPE